MMKDQNIMMSEKQMQRPILFQPKAGGVRE